MTGISNAQQHVLDEAQRVNEERMQVVEQLAAAVGHRVDLERQVSEALKEEKKLMTAAQRAGWTRAQVTRFARPPKAARTSEGSASSTTTQNVYSDSQE